jgi:beta-fructofuranosidase
MVSKPPVVEEPGPQGESVVASARTHFERTLVRVRGDVVGSVAAMEHPSCGETANYGEVFLRENVPVMFHLLLERRFSIVRHFLQVCLELQSHSDQTRGIFPISFVEQGQELIANYGQRSIGRISSVDASLSWRLLCWFYVQRCGDRDFALREEGQDGLARPLDLVMRPSFEGTSLLFVPDCAFMIDRPMDGGGRRWRWRCCCSAVCASCCHLMDLAQRDRLSEQRERRLGGTRRWLRDLRDYLLKNYWAASKTVQVLRRRPTEQYGERLSMSTPSTCKLGWCLPGCRSGWRTGAAI